MTTPQPAFVRPFEDSFRATSKPQLRPVLNSHNQNIPNQINHQESVVKSLSSLCSTTQAVTTQSTQDPLSENVSKPPMIPSNHQPPSQAVPYSTPQYHHPHIPVSHVPSLYKPPHFTPPSPHHQHPSTKLNIPNLSINHSTNISNNSISTKLPTHHVSEAQPSTGSLQRTDVQININNNCITNDKPAANANYYNNHIMSGSKAISRNYKNNSENVQRDHRNSNNEKNEGDNQPRQTLSTQNHSTNHSLVEKPVLPHLAYEHNKGPTFQPLNLNANDKDCKSEIDVKPQVDQSIVMSTLPFQPVVKFSLNDIAQKPIDTAQLMQSIKSEEVLRTCQNVSNVLLQIPKYQEKLLNFSNNELKSAFCFTDKCNNLTEISVKCESAVLKVPDLSKSLVKQEIVNDKSFLMPDKPKELTSTLDLAEKRRKRKREKSIGVSISSDSEGEEDVKDSDLWITKGPPSKLLCPAKKLSFLAMFGLTTLSTRNEMELCKVEKRYKLNPEPPDPPLDSEPVVESFLPIPREHPDVLLQTPDFVPKVGFLKTIGLDVMPPSKRDEAEVSWQYILQDRKKRKSVNTVTAYCERIAKAYSRNPPLLPRPPQKMRLLDRVKQKQVPERPPPLPPLVANIPSTFYSVLPLPGENGIKQHCKIQETCKTRDEVDGDEREKSGWNGIEDIMFAYMEYSKEKILERKVLAAQTAKLAARSNNLRSEALQLERRRNDLLSNCSALETERRALSEKIERINSLLRTLR